MIVLDLLCLKKKRKKISGFKTMNWLKVIFASQFQPVGFFFFFFTPFVRLSQLFLVNVHIMITFEI